MSDLLKEARAKLEFAQVLGYGTIKSFKNLYDQLGEIENKTQGGKWGRDFFVKIKASISELLKVSSLGKEK